MRDIEASNTGGGGINPNYDPALQPRDRSRASSQAQIGQVAQNLNPEVLTTDFHRIDAGSPIVDASGNVLRGGNGAHPGIAARRRAAPRAVQAYRNAIKSEARAHGIDPAMVDKMENPVLVRRLEGGGRCGSVRPRGQQLGHAAHVATRTGQGRRRPDQRQPHAEAERD